MNPTDYHERLLQCARYARSIYRPLWSRYEGIRPVMNKLLFDESWRSGVQSILNYTADQSAYYMGTDIAMSFLRELKGEYRIDILHPTGEAGKRSAEAFSAIFLNRLDGLIEDPNNRH